MSNSPTLGELFSRSISLALGGVNTALPGRVVQFYPEERRVDVQPVIRKQMPDGTLLDYPTLLSIPVQYPCSSTSMFYFPLNRGDSVMVVFSQASLDNWLAADDTKPVDPADNSRFNISDAIAIPGVSPFLVSRGQWDSQILTKDDSSVIIKHNIGTPSECEIILSEDGQVTLQSATGVNTRTPVLASSGDVTAVLGSLSMTTMAAQIVALQVQVSALTAAMGLVQAAAATHVHPVTSAPGVTGVAQ